MFSKTNYLFIKRIPFLFGSDKLGLYFRILDSNLTKLKNRQTPDIVIRLIVVNAFGTTVRIKKTNKTKESFAFIIITRSYLYRILKNQL